MSIFAAVHNLQIRAENKPFDGVLASSKLSCLKMVGRYHLTFMPA